jgi:hypothetical protein
MAFPLAAAHEALPKDGIERSFIHEVTKLIQKRKVSNVFVNPRPEIKG